MVLLLLACPSPPSSFGANPLVAATATAATCERTGGTAVCAGSGIRLQVGPYNLTVCNSTAWTFRDLWHDGAEVLSPTGFAQTVSNVNIPPNTGAEVWPPVRPVSPACPVIPQANNSAPAPGAPSGSGFLGTGHGGEFVFSVTLEVLDLTTNATVAAYDVLAAGEGAVSGGGGGVGGGDGRSDVRGAGERQWYRALRHNAALPPLPASVATWTNAKLAVVKESQLGPFVATQRATLHPELGLRVRANYTLAYANNASAVNWFYPCMSMFALPFAEWVAELGNGTMVGPVRFRADDSFSLQANIRWAAVYDPSGQRGAVYQYPRVYNGSKGFFNSFWNRAYDHKLYLRADVPTVLGAQFGFAHEVQGFTAGSAEWVDTASAMVRDRLPPSPL